MKKLIAKLIVSILLIYSEAVKTCPYIFTNDTKGPVLVVEQIGNAYIVPAGKVVQIQAPMIENKSHSTEKWRLWQGHSPVSIYIPTTSDSYGNEVFEVLYETRERHCGKGSSLTMSRIMKVQNKEDYDRFRIRRMNEGRKIKRLQKYEKRKLLDEQLTLEENPEKILKRGANEKRKCFCPCEEMQSFCPCAKNKKIY